MDKFSCVLQYPFSVLKQEGGCPMKGRWHTDYFHNENPIVLELGCGKGEYTIGLAKKFPSKNFIGIDIKGARMYTGARQAEEESLANVAFLRTSIELIAEFFAPGEVSEIWITFPDPQMKKVNKRLTGTRFISLYDRILQPGGTIHLKTDSPFLYTYAAAMVRLNNLPILADTSDLYASGQADDILEIKTFYEQQWLDRGLTIKYLSFTLPAGVSLVEPDIEIEEDTYRSFSRGYIQCPQLITDNNSEL